MAEWREVELQSLGTLFDGPHATPKRTTEGPYFLNIASLDDGRLDLTQSDRVSRDQFRQWTRRVTPAGGDLLFSYETRLGDAALMPHGIEACLGRRMALLRPDRTRVDPRFLLYLYLSPAMKRTIEENTIHGATVNRIALSTMGSWRLSIPPLTEQRAIAEVLGALDDKIAANTRLATAADALAASTLRASLSGEVAPLVELATVTMGSSPPGSSYNETGDGIPFFQGVRDFGLRFPRSRVWTTSPVRFARRGDTLLSVRAPVGRVNVAPDDLCVGRGLASVRSTHGRPWSLFHLLRDAPGVWAPYEAEGTVFGSINRDQLSGLLLPTVAARDADKVERTVAGLEARLGSALAENATLAATRDALLPALMSGKLRVRDAERLVEDAL